MTNAEKFEHELEGIPAYALAVTLDGKPSICNVMVCSDCLFNNNVEGCTYQAREWLKAEAKMNDIKEDMKKAFDAYAVSAMNALRSYCEAHGEKCDGCIFRTKSIGCVLHEKLPESWRVKMEE